jgi:hypothetical protein
MIKPSLSIGAESVVIDGATNAVSLMNVIEEIRAAQFPVLIQKLALLFVLERTESDPGRPEAHLQISLSDKPLGGLKVLVDFQSQLRTRCIINIAGIPVPRPGELRADLRIAGQVLASWHVNIKLDATAFRPIQPQIIHSDYRP